jgi:ATP-binding cassette subfamily A (ABC1) protein 3
MYALFFKGHNGAGKTTTIAMLTGLIPCDGGTAMVEGMDIRSDMDDIRKNLGVCPQHDILFPDLTVHEHLIMFARFKGTPSKDLNDEVERMIESVGLTEKRHAFSKQLSGGQKRKLSVAIAFIGGSRIVFLDEPTSGMDPYSRRFTWNVIRQHREGRVIVLTTHFM